MKMKLTLALPLAAALALAIPSVVLGWHPLQGSGECDLAEPDGSISQFRYEIHATGAEEDLTIEVSGSSDFADRLQLELDAQTLSTGFVGPVSEIWVRWASDHEVVTHIVAGECPEATPTPVPNKPRANPTPRLTLPPTDSVDQVAVVKPAEDIALPIALFVIIVGLVLAVPSRRRIR